MHVKVEPSILQQVNWIVIELVNSLKLVKYHQTRLLFIKMKIELPSWHGHWHISIVFWDRNSKLNNFSMVYILFDVLIVRLLKPLTLLVCWAIDHNSGKLSVLDSKFNLQKTLTKEMTLYSWSIKEASLASSSKKFWIHTSLITDCFATFIVCFTKLDDEWQDSDLLSSEHL